MSRKIPIGVSSCLLGNKVRYDGGHKTNPFITNVLTNNFDFLAICPETGIGLGVPRPPIQLVEIQSQTHALGVDDKSIDVTSALTKYASQIVKEQRHLCGFILKTRSPSCGAGSTDLYNQDGICIGKTSGIFVAALQQLIPEIPVIDEESLQSQEKLAQFTEQVNSYYYKR